MKFFVNLMDVMTNRRKPYEEITEMYLHKTGTFRFKVTKFKPVDSDNYKEIGWRSFALTYEACKKLGVIDFDKLPENMKPIKI